MSNSLLLQIHSLEESLLLPEIRKSSDALNDLISDDYMEVGASGKIYNKKEAIASLLVEQKVQIKIENFSVKELSGNIILANYISITITDDKNNKAYRTSIWQKNTGKWQIIFHQGTPLTK